MLSSAQWETIFVLVAAASACSLLGSFLILRRVALVADAISHVLLFGIVISYLIVRDLTSLWLLVGATASGVLTVALVEALQRSRRVKVDAAIGLVFPTLFGLGTLLATLYLRNTHLDVDRVLLGSAELAPLDRFEVAGQDWGPRGGIVLVGIFLLNLFGVVLTFKELKLSTFDAGLAATLGFAPVVLHYGLMTAVSLTTVAAFDAVGPVVVVAMLVVPSASAYLLTDRLGRMIALSVVFAALAAVLGTLLAFAIDSNIAGTVAVGLGAIFAMTFLMAPQRGLVAAWLRRIRQKQRFLETMLAIHLYQHEGTPSEAEESQIGSLHRHLHWLPHEVRRVCARAAQLGLVKQDPERLWITERGRELVQEIFGNRSSRPS